jgi:pantoate--beta-alanine ligase
MATVVKKLLQTVNPNRAYFGEKDFQQLIIIRDLVRKENMTVQIIGCPIIRELDGLAMSSRNVHLTAAQRHAASGIYEALVELKERAKVKDLKKSLAKTIETINSHPHLATEYLEIVDSETLKPIDQWTDTKSARAFTAVISGNTRLIDNILLY